jgi:hypothetical protein
LKGAAQRGAQYAKEYGKRGIQWIRQKVARKGAAEGLTQAERQVLKETFGRGPEGAKRVLRQLDEGTFEVPRGLTRTALQKYRRIAQEAIDQGLDKIGTQRLRRDIIDRILREHGGGLSP